MGRRKNDSAVGRFSILILFLMGVISCCMVYYSISVVFVPSRTDPTISVLDSGQPADPEGEEEEEESEEFCCRGIEHWELWGDAVKWGSQFKLNSSEECCQACKAMCRKDGPCLCDSWVFCGNQEACGARFGECWLKKQKNSLELDRRDSGDHVMWTSGFIFAEEQGIVGLETEYGTLRLKLFPDCAPRSVAYILELLQLQHSVGFQFYRAESRGSFWDSEGNHVENAPFGPPFALVQGTLEAHGTIFKQIPAEFCPDIRRGSVAWVGSGPDFFISLANHLEWKAYTVFGSVLPGDMEIVEKISQLPTKLEVWSNINVSVLETPVTLRFRMIGSDHDNLQLQ
ncbi:Cyclophilin-like domain containing protein [Parasponia andersonii]|uniref:Cyclophilin-like domain containing protein n=1 Tax=Parasponia andersonii TaxID=3476 RepID=A0A2P5CCW1_PARAD|nr:Cyclophilin-like domain containing protein [Parasponia andersonii]